MPVRGLGWHWLWGNGMNFAISLAAVRSVDARPVHAIPCGIFAGNTRGIKRMESMDVNKFIVVIYHFCLNKNIYIFLKYNWRSVISLDKKLTLEIYTSWKPGT